jgi:hypothetical protein
MNEITIIKIEKKKRPIKQKRDLINFDHAFNALRVANEAVRHVAPVTPREYSQDPALRAQHRCHEALHSDFLFFCLARPLSRTFAPPARKVGQDTFSAIFHDLD